MHQVQIDSQRYSKRRYNDLARFISYFYQVDTLLRLGATSVFEIGVGNGITAAHLKSSGIKVTTCDFDATVHPDIVADVLSIPVADNSYDVSAAFQILEHIPFQEFGKAVAELVRVSQRYVVISVPYRSTYFECVLKLPGIRTLFKRDFFDLVLRWPLKFGGFETSGQHHWEIDRSTYKLSRVRKELQNHAVIVEEFSPVLDKFHYFFVLSKREGV